MKIVKEITVRAKIDHVRAFINDSGLFPGFCDEITDSVSNVDICDKSSLRSASDPLGVSSSKGCSCSHKYNSSIIAKFELSEKGRQARLRVTISGWEKIDSEKARTEMPRVSLRLEERLTEMKKAIEAGHYMG